MHYLYWIHLPEHKNFLSEGYIGVSNNPKRRFNDHKLYNKENPYLQNVLKKHPNIIFTILFQGSKYFCYNKEKEYRPTDRIGWNLIPGGTAPPSRKGVIPSDEHKAKISQSNKGNIPWNVGKHLSVDHKTKIGQANKGKIITEEHKKSLRYKRSDETKEKMRLSQLGKRHSDETKKKIGLAGLGRIAWNKGAKGLVKCSEETKQKMRQSHLGIVFSEQHRKHISDARKGVKLSVEHRKNIGLSQLGRVAWNKGLTIKDVRVKKYIETRLKNIQYKKINGQATDPGVCAD